MSGAIQLSDEITVGTVLVLCPKTMLTKGGVVTGPPETWVVAPHFFIAIGADKKRCRMLPLYSNDGVGREQIPTAGRTGHIKWTSGTWHYHPVQVWTASRHTIALAAKAGGDLSTAGARNLLDIQFVPVIN